MSKIWNDDDEPIMGVDDREPRLATGRFDLSAHIVSLTLGVLAAEKIARYSQTVMENF